MNTNAKRTLSHVWAGYLIKQIGIAINSTGSSRVFVSEPLETEVTSHSSDYDENPVAHRTHRGEDVLATRLRHLTATTISHSDTVEVNFVETMRLSVHLDELAKPMTA